MNKRPLISGKVLLGVFAAVTIWLALATAHVPIWVDALVFVLMGSVTALLFTFKLFLRHDLAKTREYNQTLRHGHAAMRDMHQASVTALSRQQEARIEQLIMAGWQMLMIQGRAYACRDQEMKQLTAPAAEYWREAETELLENSN
jgi:hypothetical protein